MDPVPYEIREGDIDEVLNAHELPGGARFSAADRAQIRAHVMRNVLDINEIVRTAPETDEVEDPAGEGLLPGRAGPISERPGDQSAPRRDMALGAIEDLLIRDGYIELFSDDARAFPPMRGRDTERDDG